MERPNLVGSGSGHCQKWHFISRKSYGISLPSSHRPGTVLGASFMESVGNDPGGHGQAQPGWYGLEGPQQDHPGAREPETQPGLWQEAGTWTPQALLAPAVLSG